MKRKILSLFLVSLMIFGMVACGASGSTDTLAETNDEIVAVETDSAHTGVGLAIGLDKADDQAVRDGKDFCLELVGRHNAGDALLHAEGFCASHGKLIAQIDTKIKKFIIIHSGIPHTKST